MQEYSKQVVDSYEAAAAKAKAFYTQFPDNSNAIPAKILECQMFRAAFYDSRDMDARKNAFTDMASAQDALLIHSRLTAGPNATICA